MSGAAALAFQVAMGIGLAACAGLRAFLPLLVVGVAGKIGWVELGRSFEWLASWPALVVFGVAVTSEILADKIPLVDNVLDLVQGVVKPTAGTLLAAAVLTDLTPLQATVLGLVVGGSTSGLVHLTKAKVRVFSSATTAGLGNPVLSVGEDLASLGGSVAALIQPFLLILLAVAGASLLLMARRRFRLRASRLGNRRGPHPGGGAQSAP